MKIGGVDPSIIRELSGIYRPFIKAFKELISNAYDADADLVQITLAEDLKSIEIRDDGVGMTPFEFRQDFTTIGRSHNSDRNEITKKGRPKIGSKGIGFLAVARYCDSMKIISTTTKFHSGKILCYPSQKLNLRNHFKVPVPKGILSGRFEVEDIYIVKQGKKRKLGQENYIISGTGIKFRREFHYDRAARLEVNYCINCSDIKIEAVIDFDYLLSLENQIDLEKIRDFCNIKIEQLSNPDIINKHYTKIVLQKLKPFVISELGAAKKNGNVRNISSQDGITQFVWELSRCIPVKYDLPSNIEHRFGKLLRDSRLHYIGKVIFSGDIYSDQELMRPIWLAEDKEDQALHNSTYVEVNIRDDGLFAKGYILGRPEAIFPAEYRGLTVRVRNVAIGQPSFLGLEKLLSGKHRSTLSQITGEINVIAGMDAVDALNPGRESFYEENTHYKKLKNYIIGNGESPSGLLGEIIQSILKRSQVASNVRDYVSCANKRRRALRDISGAVNYLATSTNFSTALHSFFSRKQAVENHFDLAEREDYNMSLSPNFKISDFKVENIPGLVGDSLVNFAEKKIYFDFTQERWSWRLFILGNYFEVVNKAGKYSDPICEIDTQKQKIYINWTHPVRNNMDEKSFIKSAIAWRLAHHVCINDVDKMMNLGLNILSYST
ncbi:hypothetical protein GF312_04115 [Candidatus Poribacteria bacterium]|nr:hypothetical protein [Candidatus Poribacteria bacterium]